MIADAEKEKSIAVLPFVNMSGEEDQEYFADGPSEELINMLTRVPNLKVIGRTSSFVYKNKNEDLRDIGKALGVSYLLEGSVRKSENRIRITAQLIQTSDGSHLWSNTYDKKLDDIFEIQDQISASVADALRITLSANEDTPVRQANNPEAYNYFLRGRFHYETQFRDTDTDLALKWFNEAIGVDSTFSLAWTYASMCYWRKSRNSQDEVFKKARYAAFKALELDPSSGIAAVNVAEILDNEFDFKGALEKIDLALRLEPKDPYVLRNAGRFYTILGRQEESIDFCQEALKYDPIQRTALLYLISAYFYAGQYELAMPFVKKLLNFTEYLPAHQSLEILLHLEGPEALKEFENREGSDSYGFKILMAIGSGNNEEALSLLEKAIASKRYSPYMVSRAYARLGVKEEALNYLEEAYLVKDKAMVYVKVDPIFDDLRDNDRLKNIIEQLDYPE